MELQDKRRWPRVTLTLPPDLRDQLHELAKSNYRDPKREALRLLADGIDRERSTKALGHG